MKMIVKLVMGPVVGNNVALLVYTYAYLHWIQSGQSGERWPEAQYWQLEASPAMLELMHGRAVAYVHAEIEDEGVLRLSRREATRREFEQGARQSKTFTVN